MATVADIADHVHEDEDDRAGSVPVSVVVPVYAGADYLEELIASLAAVRDEWARTVAPMALSEVVLVDDAAIDRSPEIVDALAERYPWVVPLHLSRNYGQHAATIAGILHTAGAWVVTMDEDLQHPPERIAELLETATRQGADIVYARPEGAVHGAAMRDRGSRGFKRIMSFVTNDPNLPLYNSFRLLRGPIARAAASVCGHDTYFDVNLSWFSQRVAAVSMVLEDLRFQRTGRSGYSFRSLVSHALRMLFSSHLKILRLGSLTGIIVLGLSGLGGLWVLAARLFYPETITQAGWASLIVAVAFFGGLTIFLLGITLQYLSTLTLRAHGRPVFFTVDRSDDALLARWFAGSDRARAKAG
ncbi:MAG: glycosyltransferase [Pseudomonadota bacterium]